MAIDSFARVSLCPALQMWLRRQPIALCEIARRMRGNQVRQCVAPVQRPGHEMVDVRVRAAEASTAVQAIAVLQVDQQIEVLAGWLPASPEQESLDVLGLSEQI